MAFADLINRKYQLEQQRASSESNLQSAQAEQARGATALAPGRAAAEESQAYGVGAGERGRGGYYSALAGTETARNPSQIALTTAQAGQAAALAGESRVRTTPFGAGGIPSVSLPGGDLIPGIKFAMGTSAVPGMATLGMAPVIAAGTAGGENGVNGLAPTSGFGNYAEGGSNVPRINAMNGKTSVPGKMPPQGQNTDVTPANLTPGEAVLNRGAAEHLGRDVIDVLNAIGNIKMQGDKGAVSTSGPVTKAPTDSENGVKGYCMGGVPGYAQGSASAGQIDPIAGQGGTWAPAPEPKFNPRAAVGIQGVPRPGYADGMSDIPEPGAAVGYADGTSDVMARTHADAARNSHVGKGGGKAESSSEPAPEKAAAKPSTNNYAKGTGKVPSKGAKKPAAGASKITPEMLQQLMALSKGGGGMIPPGQGAPMPMPMPQVAPGGGMGP